MTLSGAKCASLKQEKAKEFAFLLFIPAALGSFIFSLDDAKYLFQDSQMVILSMIAMIVAFIFTLLSLTFIFKKFNNKHYRYFAIYLVFYWNFYNFYWYLNHSVDKPIFQPPLEQLGKLFHKTE